MADEIMDETLDETKEHPIDKRINKALSEKAKAEEEKLKSDKVAEKAKLEAETAKKDAEFYKNFNTMTSKYPSAGELQDKIREKVMAGYDMEDATVAVLNKEGKFTPTTSAPVKESPAGGSSPTTIKSGEKSIGDMSKDEKREALKDTLIFS